MYAPLGPEEGIEFFGIGVTDTYCPGGYWKLNLGPVQEQQVLLPLRHLTAELYTPLLPL